MTEQDGAPAETDPLREIERLREALKDARQRGGDFAAVWAVVTDALGDG